MVFTEEASLECTQCAAVFPATAKFCGSCGAPRALALGVERLRDDDVDRGWVADDSLRQVNRDTKN